MIMITDGIMRMIEQVKKKLNSSDRLEILSLVCHEMEIRYPGNSLEYHLSQMGIRTTNDILDAIDIYLIMIELEPDTTFEKRTKKNSRKKANCN